MADDVFRNKYAWLSMFMATEAVAFGVLKFDVRTGLNFFSLVALLWPAQLFILGFHGPVGGFMCLVLWL
ncbi:hypothetical protein KZO85_14590 [Chromohalobacter canadensis]|uniref:hypothetical protein n=1 Tax=Chromohalobacter canadensis TaxID=141389 RepID=UPI0021BE04AA|nr:hypothetical protein [Chromohalobacter canadensis]MCT8469814.1 hypothetical protein [Chromohalobacter canadensis]MCT8499536.1 hypothetical protein [Chromohalobacter canadensis]